MGRFARRFTDAEKAAMVAAVVDQNGPRMSVLKAIEKAKTGDIEGLDRPLTMSSGYLYDMVRDERRARAGQGTDGTSPDERLDSITRRMVTSLDAGVRAYERRVRRHQRNAKAKAPDPQDLIKYARAGQEIRKLMTPEGKGHKPPSEIPGSVPDTPLAQMLEAHKQSAGKGSPELAPDDDANVTPIRPETGPPNGSKDGEQQAVRAERHAAGGSAEPNANVQSAREGGQQGADFRSALAQLEEQARKARGG